MISIEGLPFAFIAALRIFTVPSGLPLHCDGVASDYDNEEKDNANGGGRMF